MTHTATAVAAEELTTLTARVLGAYYCLLAEGHPTEWIGGREIAEWIRRRLPGADVPSDSTVTKTLVAAGLAHRSRGQPTLQSRATSRSLREDQLAPPLCPVRPTAPRPRSRSR